MREGLDDLGPPGRAAEPAPLDVRPEAAFRAGHAARAAHIPLEEVLERVHELPPAATPLLVLDDDPRRAEAAAALLRERGHEVATGGASDPSLGPRAEGPAGARLWRPSAFLARALAAVRAELPARPRAVDVACGSGRDAVFLALAGCEVEALDVLPDALARAARLAARCGVAVETRAHDLERDPTLPGARYDLVHVARFLWRPLFPALAAALRPGGFVVYETFHERTRETGRPPRSEAHLLATGELSRAFAGFEVRTSEEAVPLEGDGRYVSRLCARRPAR
jgi:rhodanese-related sulfurtransferase